MVDALRAVGEWRKQGSALRPQLEQLKGYYLGQLREIETALAMLPAEDPVERTPPRAIAPTPTTVAATGSVGSPRRLILDVLEAHPNGMRAGAIVAALKGNLEARLVYKWLNRLVAAKQIRTEGPRGSQLYFAVANGVARLDLRSAQA